MQTHREPKGNDAPEAQREGHLGLLHERDDLPLIADVFACKAPAHDLDQEPNVHIVPAGQKAERIGSQKAVNGSSGKLSKSCHSSVCHLPESLPAATNPCVPFPLQTC